MRIVQIEKISESVISGAIPALGYDILVRLTPEEDQVWFLMGFAQLSFGLDGSILSVANPVIEYEKVDYQKTLRLRFPFPRDVIGAVESKRTDDLTLNLQLSMYFFIQSQSSTSLRFYVHSEYISVKYSQKEWNQILEKMGYSESWVIEVSRPEIESFPEVVEHLHKASDCLFIRDYEGCMTNTRAAWNSLEPMLKAKWEHIAKQIDEGSPGEESYSSKSKRIEELIAKIKQWSNVGPHREAYRIFPEDAILSYYITVSTVSYLSKWLRNIPL